MRLAQAAVIWAVLGWISGTPFGSQSPSGVLWVNTPGETVLFNTFWDPKPFSFISWKISDITIFYASSPVSNFSNPEYADRITLFSDFSLELRNLTLDDPGTYTVNIVPLEGRQINEAFSLAVLEPVSDVRLVASSTDLEEYWSVGNLTCSASGSNLQFSWYNGSNILDHDSPILILNPLRRYDTGPFRCEAYNLINRASSEALNLTISYGPDVPILKTVPSGTHYLEGTRVTLHCKVESSPDAEITWYFNGNPLYFEAELILDPVGIVHSGTYVCYAFNPRTMLTSFKSVGFTVVERLPDTSDALPDRFIAGIVIICLLAFANALACAFLQKRKRIVLRNQNLNTQT